MMNPMLLQQTATWKPKIGQDEFNKPTFGAPSDIKVRWEARQRLVTNQIGKEVVSSAEVICLEAVSIGDVLTFSGRDYAVIDSQPVPMLSGAISHYELSV